MRALKLPHAQQTGITAPYLTQEQRFYSTLATRAQNTKLGKTPTVGAPTGIEYTELHPEGGVLVGFDIWKGNFNSLLVVNGIRPIFQTATGKVRGKVYGSAGGTPTTVEAKDGFAVAGIDAKGGDRVDQLRVVFMRISYASFNLDSAGSYKTDWIGGKGGTRERRLVSNPEARNRHLWRQRNKT